MARNKVPKNLIIFKKTLQVTLAGFLIFLLLSFVTLSAHSSGSQKSKRHKKKNLSTFNSPGNFLVLNEALVIIDFDTVTTVVDGVRATEIPIGPSLG